MTLMNHVAKDFAAANGLSETEVIDRIKHRELNGFKENGYWYVKVNMEGEDELEVKDNVSSPKKSSKKPVSWTLVVSIVLFLTISFFGYQFYSNIEKEKSEKALELFSTKMAEVSSKLTRLAAMSTVVIEDIRETWRSTISSGYDINVAIKNTLLGRSDEIKSIKSLSTEIALYIKQMPHPADKEGDYKRLRELYLLFNRYADMATSPSGSLMAYTQQYSKLSVEIKSAIRELEMMR